jgi:penicillin amidase
MQLTHAFGKKAPLDRLFHPAPVPCPGDASTIAQAAVDLAHPDQNPVGVPTLRTVIDVGAWHNSRFIVIHGQSGNPYSPHYLDQLPIWQRGGGIPIAWSDEDIARSTCHTLELTPKPTRGRWLQKKA